MFNSLVVILFIIVLFGSGMFFNNGYRNIENRITILYAVVGIFALYGFITFIPTFAVSWRRMHDTGRNWAFWLISLLGYIGHIFFMILAAQDSQPGENKYVPNPKDEALGLILNDWKEP